MNVQTIKYGTNLVISTVVFIGILVLVAFITTRHHVRKDLTASGMFSLADQTKKVLKDLNKPVSIYGFYKESDQVGAKDMLDEYSYRSNQIHVEFIDPNEKPQIARQYQVTQYNTIVVA